MYIKAVEQREVRYPRGPTSRRKSKFTKKALIKQLTQIKRQLLRAVSTPFESKHICV